MEYNTSRVLVIAVAAGFAAGLTGVGIGFVVGGQRQDAKDAELTRIRRLNEELANDLRVTRILFESCMAIQPKLGVSVNKLMAEMQQTLGCSLLPAAEGELRWASGNKMAVIAFNGTPINHASILARKGNESSGEFIKCVDRILKSADPSLRRVFTSEIVEAAAATNRVKQGTFVGIRGKKLIMKVFADSGRVVVVLQPNRPVFAESR